MQGLIMSLGKSLGPIFRPGILIYQFSSGLITLMESAERLSRTLQWGSRLNFKELFMPKNFYKEKCLK